jgi:hypothetical protein
VYELDEGSYVLDVLDSLLAVRIIVYLKGVRRRKGMEREGGQSKGRESKGWGLKESGGIFSGAGRK